MKSCRRSLRAHAAVARSVAFGAIAASAAACTTAPGGSLGGAWQIEFQITPPGPDDEPSFFPESPVPGRAVGVICLRAVEPFPLRIDFDIERSATLRGGYHFELAALGLGERVTRGLERFHGGKHVAAARFDGDSIVIAIPPNETEWYIQLRGRLDADTVRGIWFTTMRRGFNRRIDTFLMTRASPQMSCRAD